MSEVTVRGRRATTDVALGEVATVERTPRVEAMIKNGYLDEVKPAEAKKAAKAGQDTSDLRGSAAQVSPAGGDGARSRRAGG